MNGFSLEELAGVVAELAEKYTEGESTSITYDMANQLMGAAIYCIQEYQSSGNRGEALPQRLGISAKEAYGLGYDAVVKKAKAATELYQKIMEQFCDYQNEAYHETVAEGIPAFFRYYDVMFEPQNEILTLDYPVLFSLEKERGIDRIYDYLSCIAWEQNFLKKLPAEEIYRILKAYHPEYETLFINVASIVVRHLVVRALTAQKQEIEEEIKEREEAELQGDLRMIVEGIMAQWYDGDRDMTTYFKQDMVSFAKELKHGAKEGYLSSLLRCDFA